MNILQKYYENKDIESIDNFINQNKKLDQKYYALGLISLIHNDHMNAYKNFTIAYKNNKQDNNTVIILKILLEECFALDKIDEIIKLSSEYLNNDKNIIIINTLFPITNKLMDLNRNIDVVKICKVLLEYHVDINIVEKILANAIISADYNTYSKYFDKYDYLFNESRRNMLNLYKNMFTTRYKYSELQIINDRFNYNNNLNKLLSSKLKINDIHDIISPWGLSTTFKLAYHNKNNVIIFTKLSKLLRQMSSEMNFVAPFIKNYKKTGDKIKIGFITSFFRDHSVTKDRKGMIKLLDRNIFDVYTLFINDVIDPVGHDIKNNTIYIKLDKDILNMQKQIANLKLDIILFFEIGMELTTCMIAHSRLAPIQMSTWDHPDTSCIDTIDYFVSSKLFEQKNAQTHFKEKLILNNGSTIYYYNPLKFFTEQIKKNDIIEKIRIDKKANIYFCPATLFKIHPNMDHVFVKY